MNVSHLPYFTDELCSDSDQSCLFLLHFVDVPNIVLILTNDKPSTNPPFSQANYDAALSAAQDLIDSGATIVPIGEFNKGERSVSAKAVWSRQWRSGLPKRPSWRLDIGVGISVGIMNNISAQAFRRNG